ncbi:MAG: protease modulator HflC [gamma proteobacterium symbiont of Bathyaustriella thionipta]|nr:protease modulator HflC [gamma proteobacterium symbiont of Bathyaustriella thionipta]
MSGKQLLFLILAPLLAILVYASTFIVYEWQLALKLQLGEIKRSDYAPGLHVMTPFINNVKIFDGRIQTLDARPERFLTDEKKDVIVDFYAKWRISDVAQYYRSTGGDINNTQRLLEERISTALRNEFGKRTIQEVVSGERREIMEKLTQTADTQSSELGVEVVDVRIKKIDLPAEVSENVYERMRSERERVARDLRAQGAEAAERIQADADRQKTVILANAYKEAEQLRGTGDARSAEIYASAYQKDAEFYAFYRSLEAYRKSFGQGDVFVIEPDSEFFNYFGNSRQ